MIQAGQFPAYSFCYRHRHFRKMQFIAGTFCYIAHYTINMFPTRMKSIKAEFIVDDNINSDQAHKPSESPIIFMAV